MSRLPLDWGWGAELDGLLGGGLAPGMMVSLASARGAPGKTAWLGQLADGLAMRTSEQVRTVATSPLTPVVVVSALGASALSWRTLGRWTCHDYRIFRAGASAATVLGIPEDEVERAFAAARSALRGELGMARKFLRVLAPADTPTIDATERLARLGAVVRGWCDYLAGQYEREVWPVIVIDPIERWVAADPGVRELAAERLADRTREEGWITIVSTESAWPAPEGTSVPGADRLPTLSDVSFALERAPGVAPLYRLHIVKNQWGPQEPDPAAWTGFEFDGPHMRFHPVGQREWLARAARPSRERDRERERDRARDV
jgi:hypothetical protein